MRDSDFRKAVVGIIGISVFLGSSLVMAASKKPSSTSEGDEGADEAAEELPIKRRATKITSSGKRIRELDDDEIDSRSSEAKRESLKGEVLFDLVGFTPSPTSGIALGYYLKPRHILSVRYGEASGVLSNMDEKIYSVTIKSFWANSFYTNMGLSKRDYKYKWDAWNYDASGSISTSTQTKADRTSLGFEFHIGNQWQWDSFTLGTDWIGMFIPTTTSGSNTAPSNSAASLESIFTASDWNYAKENQVAFLRFYLGWAF